MNNKNTILNPKDKTFEDYKENSTTTAQNQAIRAYKDKSFEEEYKPLHISATSLKYICSLFSAITMITAIYFVLSPLVNKILVLIIAFSFCTFFEIVKSYTWSVTSKNLLKYKRASKVAILALTSIHLLSFGSSVYGAWKIPTLIQPKNSVITASKVDSINKSYLGQRSIIDLQIKELSNKTNSSTIRGTIRALTAQKSKILEAQKAAIESEKKLVQQSAQENKEKSLIIANNHKERISELQVSCVSLAVLFEIAFILSCIFISYYLFRCFIDLDNRESSSELVESSEEKTEINQIGARASNVNAQKIGFLQGAENKEVNGKSKTENGKSNSEKLKYTKICKLESCKTKFLHNVHNQKYCSVKCKAKAHIERKKNSNS